MLKKKPALLKPKIPKIFEHGLPNILPKSISLQNLKIDVSKLESYTIVLASQSENRQKILKQAGITNFLVSPSNFKEDLDKSIYTPLEYVIRTSEGKVHDKI